MPGTGGRVVELQRAARIHHAVVDLIRHEEGAFDLGGLALHREGCYRAARFIGQQAIQLHGGIGMTDEYPAAHYFRRLTAIGSLFGDVDFHMGRFVAAGAVED